ncbi:MAG: hypothetical protein Q7J59_02710 [Elusimicrobiota bacterium]|nr:hypothetical protein [Elusimicrobiota bacterium]
MVKRLLQILALFLGIPYGAAAADNACYVVSPAISVFREASVILSDETGGFIVNPAGLYGASRPEIAAAYAKDYNLKNVAYRQPLHGKSETAFLKIGVAAGSGGHDNNSSSLAIGCGPMKKINFGVLLSRHTITNRGYSNLSFSGMVSEKLSGSPGLRLCAVAGLSNMRHSAVLPRTLRMGIGLEDKNKFRVALGYTLNEYEKHLALGAEFRVYKRFYSYFSPGDGWPAGVKWKLSNSEISAAYADGKALLGFQILFGKSGTDGTKNSLSRGQENSQKNDGGSDGQNLQKQHYDSGMDYYLDGNFIVAEEQFQKVISIDAYTDYSTRAEELLEKIKILKAKNREQKIEGDSGASE